ncbi:phosphoribosylamine--glycine ligase [Xanthovirga aplysinae]|uniref:phosphoribosylamine--glycine ligase n=1 Tax=Xanthovirga aplysinae TaxID=2529853 RepID=UPI0012BB6863|nr:phosphoribosylamine--glycine ligase [Xanthovirga aplysinae]MTI31704.1 phosphoribosylamine--glycine ligase [Xanthovirga aplysinae]
MNVLVVGAGGREHALAWKIKQSEKCDHLYVAPGNAGTAEIAENVAIGVNDFEGLAQFVLKQNIELLVVGPEDPLVNGIRDFFESREELRHVLIIGPGKAGARLEGSKDYSKSFMNKYQIPTAKSRTFTAEELEEGLKYLESMSAPLVLKADGLAAGKGVIIAQSLEEAKLSLKEMLIDGKFGEASAKVVIEEFLEGIELSVFVLTDGENYKILPEAKDYKRIGEGDTGLNTGGMGAVSPVGFAHPEFLEKVNQRVVIPTIEGLKKEGILYNGFIFIGLMNVKGDPYVIEYNVRMGDPETEVVIPRIKSDLLELLLACGQGQLDEADLEVDERAATTVMLVSGGYPEAYEKGRVINGLKSLNSGISFHAGTKINEKGEVITNGGRVIALTGMGKDTKEALKVSYKGAEKIEWEDVYYRNDIGQDLLGMEKG